MVFVRAAFLITGLWLLVRTDPPLAASAQHQGQVWFKGIGGFLLVLAALPFRMPRGNQKPASDVEDL